jgi:hypothetical protein
LEVYLLQLKGNNNRRNWTIKARDARRITAAEMKRMRRAAG